ncbi:hypothetical protein WJX84_004046 [Apatococcus fuscideae]|uniref:PB1 domain-containing protein n=1 Tax=Apatococcus fuscideae TaxID=2026836 RepID=A0AAW1STT6_9CHLO
MGETSLQARDKIKFVCRWGGRWKAPDRGQPAAFEGGDTKLCSVAWPTTIPKFVQKLQELTETTITGSLAIRYQIEGFQTEDDLVALDSEDDLENFKDEYDQLTKAGHSSSDGPRHLRLYLLPLRRTQPHFGAALQEKLPVDVKNKAHVRFLGDRSQSGAGSEQTSEPIKAVHVEKPAQKVSAGRTSLKKFFGVRTSYAHPPETGDKPLTRMSSILAKASPSTVSVTDGLGRQSSGSSDDQGASHPPASPGRVPGGATGLSTVLSRSPSQTGKQRSSAAIPAARPDAAPKAEILAQRADSADEQSGQQTPFLSAKEEECATEIEAAVNQAWDFKNNLMTTTIVST